MSESGTFNLISLRMLGSRKREKRAHDGDDGRWGWPAAKKKLSKGRLCTNRFRHDVIDRSRLDELADKEDSSKATGCSSCGCFISRFRFEGLLESEDVERGRRGGRGASELSFGSASSS